MTSRDRGTLFRIMIRWLALHLLLWVPSVLSYVMRTEEELERLRMERQNERAGEAIAEMLNKYEGGWESYMKSRHPLFIQNPADDYESLILPNEIWLGKILPQVDDFWALFALGQVSKALNYLIRKWYHDVMVKKVDVPLAFEFVRNSEIFLTQSAMGYMKKFLEQARKNKKDTNELVQLRLEIYNRTKDLAVVQKAYHYCANPASFPEVPEAGEIVRDIRVVKGTAFHPGSRDIERRKETQYIWLPEHDDGLPLLLRFDPRTVSAMLGQHLCRFRTMFFPHLLAQYILPTFHKEKRMTMDALQPFLALMKANGFFEYFHYLYRALYYLDGDLKRASHHKDSSLYKVTQFLISIGFDTGAFTVCRPANARWGEEKYQVEEEMWSILRVAQHWNLDWKGIADKTQCWCKLSKRIMEGEVPEGLHPWDPITPHDVFKVAFWHETEVNKPAYEIIDGYVVLDAVEERRKRIRERTLERQQTKRQRKLEERQNTQDVAEDSENESQPSWIETQMLPSHQLPFNPMPTFNSPFMGPVQHQAPILPQLQLDHTAFLVPPQRAPPAPQPAQPLPMEQFTAPMHPTLYLLPVHEMTERPGNASIDFSFTGPVEQAKVFQEMFKRIGRRLTEHGLLFKDFSQNEEEAPMNMEAATLQEIAGIEQELQVFTQEYQRSMILTGQRNHAPQAEATQTLESPFFIDTVDINLMDLDGNAL